MKPALIFLATLLVITHQQFIRTKGMLRLSPYLQWPAINNYQPIYYDDIKENIPFFRHLSPPKPFIDSFNDELYPDPTLLESAQNSYEDGYQSRNKGQMAPSYQQSDARYFFFISNNNANKVNNPFFKTTTFTLTSTVTVASIQSCVPKDQFADPEPPVCRRKRTIDANVSEDDQFRITPSETLQLTATASPSLTQMRNKRQLQIDEMASYDLLSSKVDEASLGEVSRNLLNHKTKEKRFFFKPNANYFVVSTTVTSYFFITTIVTQVVNLGPAGDAVNLGNVLCLPFGYTTCAP